MAQRIQHGELVSRRLEVKDQVDLAEGLRSEMLERLLQRERRSALGILVIVCEQ